MNLLSKKYAYALAAILFLGGVYFFNHRSEEYIRPTSGKNIIAFGDSLVEGVGASEGNNFVSVLSRESGVPIINAGKSGDTTVSAISRLEADVLSQDPRIVILLLGGNDALRRMPMPETFKNLQFIIQRIKATGATVILLGVRGGLLNDRYEDEFRALANEEKILHVPDVLDGIFGKSALMHDGIHPNDEGYARIAERIAPVLELLLRAE
jgi:acyl-CoA thioesterase-1